LSQINHQVGQGIVVPNLRTRSFALIETAERMGVLAWLVLIVLNLMSTEKFYAAMGI